MLSALIAGLVPTIVSSIFDKAENLFGLYLQKQITREQLQAELSKALLAALVEVEKAHADALAKTFDSFMKAVVQSKLMQCVWGVVVLSQLVVLLWHQLGIPALCYFVGKASCYPSSGTTVDWAYLLLAGAMGLGPVMLRGGPGALDTSKIKSLVGR